MSAKWRLGFLLDFVLQRNAEHDVWLHLSAAHLGQFEYDDVLTRRHEFDMFVGVEVSQSEYDADRYVHHQLGDLERQRLNNNNTFNVYIAQINNNNNNNKFNFYIIII